MSSCEAMPRRWLTHCCSWAIEHFLWANLSGAVLGTKPLLSTTFSCCSLGSYDKPTPGSSCPSAGWCPLWLLDGGGLLLLLRGMALGGGVVLPPSASTLFPSILSFMWEHKCCVCELWGFVSMLWLIKSWCFLGIWKKKNEWELGQHWIWHQKIKQSMAPKSQESLLPILPHLFI